MKADESINMLKQMLEPGGHVMENTAYINALKMGIAALEKQIPMKPRMAGSQFEDPLYACPRCGVLAEKPDRTPVWLEGSLYCASCGQAIDWRSL